MLITCPECKKEYSSDAKQCIHCGARNPERTSAGAKIAFAGAAVAILIFAFLTLGAMQSSSPEGQARSKDRDAISYCWQQQKDPSLDPATQRFVAATCEKMEADFRTKYGADP